MCLWRNKKLMYSSSALTAMMSKPRLNLGFWWKKVLGYYNKNNCTANEKVEETKTNKLLRLSIIFFLFSIASKLNFLKIERLWFHVLIKDWNLCSYHKTTEFTICPQRKSFGINKSEISLLTRLSSVLSLTKFSRWSLTSERSFLEAVTMDTMTSCRIASSGSCDLTFKYSAKQKSQCKKGFQREPFQKNRFSHTGYGCERYLWDLLPDLDGSLSNGWRTSRIPIEQGRGCRWT